MYLLVHCHKIKSMHFAKFFDSCFEKIQTQMNHFSLVSCNVLPVYSFFKVEIPTTYYYLLLIHHTIDRGTLLPKLLSYLEFYFSTV